MKLHAIPKNNSPLTVRLELSPSRSEMAGSFELVNYHVTLIDVVTGSQLVDVCNTQGEDYRFGFNGQEKDNEVKGKGNSLDFGARIYDSRLGRWASLDPLQAEYPSLSPYHYAGNNPIYYIDMEGKYFTGSTKQLLTIYKTVCAKADAGDVTAQEYKAHLEAMDGSDVEYNIQIGDDDNLIPGGIGGIARFDFANNRVQMIIHDNDEYESNGGATDYGDNLYGRTAHELAHGRQFENGDIGFYRGENGTSPYALDYYDEANAIDISSDVNNWLSYGFKPNGDPVFPKTQEQIESQKIKYNHLPQENKKASDDESESDLTDENKESKSKVFNSRNIYTPTREQESAKKTILTHE